ncbi:MAG: 3-deoxy-D-manno-octulosonic acid transferase [Planctomycetota bacterium]
MRNRLISAALDLGYCLALLVLGPWLLFLVLAKRRGLGSWRERLGASPRLAPDRPRLWLHAVSVGELEVALSLIARLEAARPAFDMVLSTTTMTAQRLARSRRPDLTVFLLPIDLGFCVRRALQRLSPTLLVLVELELWPNLVLLCEQRGVPILVVNGRVSSRGHRRMRRVRFAFAPFLRRVDRWLVQNAEYGERLRDLGVEPTRIQEVGNLKYDRDELPEPAACRREFERTWSYPAALRWIAGCTHPGEEDLVLGVHRELLGAHPELTLILAPRHVERAAEVAALAETRGFTVGRSSIAPPASPRAPQVVVVDQTGVLLQHYACADVAFVGGSLVPRGGHNVLEPFLAGTATLHGPAMANFQEIVDRLRASGAVEEVVDAAGLAHTVAQLLASPAERADRVRRGRETLARHRGAANVTAGAILARLLGRGSEGALREPH